MSMNCPTCDAPALCKDSRKKEGFTYRRYRCSANPSHRWATVEVVVAESTKGKGLLEVTNELALMFDREAYIRKLRKLQLRLTEMANELVIKD